MNFLSAVVAWSLNNRPIVIVATLLFVALGLKAAFDLPVDAVPDVTSVQVQIITAAPALSPTQVEQYVTVPIERVMAGLPKLQELRSLSKYGISVATVVFEDGTDIHFARQLVSERMRDAAAAVPQAYGVPVMGPTSTGLGEIFQFTVENEKLSLGELKDLFQWVVKPQLKTVPGVVDVNGFGGHDREYQVLLDPQRMQSAGVTVADVALALESSNANAGGGYIERSREYLVVGAYGLLKSLEDIGHVVVRSTEAGAPLTVGSLGRVVEGATLRRGAATKDGKGEVVVGVTLMLMGANARVVTEAVKSKLEAIKPALPKGTHFGEFYDRSELVSRTMRTVASNLIEGALLVIGILFLLLGSLRAGLVVATTIPLAMLFAVLLMNLTGVTGNLMSLGAIDFGLIVDGAVIIVENAVRRLSEKSTKSRVDVVYDATVEVRSATLFGEVIIAIVYLPVLALTGIEGKLFRPMAITVLFALAGAFVCSLTVIPVLTSFWVKADAEHRDTWLLKMLSRGFAPLQRVTLKHPMLTMGLSCLLLLVALGLFPNLGAEFVPQLDEGEVLVEARRLPGTALSESVNMGKRAERALGKIPEVISVVSRTGSPDLATDPMGVEQTDIYIKLAEVDRWRKGLSKSDLAEEVSTLMQAHVPEMASGISQPIQMRTNELVAGIKSDAAAIIYGPDLDTLATMGRDIGQVIEKVHGAVDVRVEHVSGLTYLEVTPDRPALARHGLSALDINRLVESLSVGHPAGSIFQGERRYPLVVKLDLNHESTPLNLEQIQNLMLTNTSGSPVPLGQVAQVAFRVGPVEVNREAQSRRLVVEFNVRGRDVNSVVNDAQADVKKIIKAQEGYHIEWGGTFQHYQEAKLRLAVVVPMALVLILSLLWLAFGQMGPAWLIFLNVPFAAVGGILALWIRGIPFSVSAAVGFVALFGVAMLNGLVLVTVSRRLEAEGMSPVDAIAEAARARLRPVLMTALVASLGFVPMALSSAPGSEVQRPLATVVIGGIMSATFLTLVVLPVVYTIFFKKTPSHTKL